MQQTSLMKTAEYILKSHLDQKIAIINNPDYTFNKVIEAMEKYAEQFKPKWISVTRPEESGDYLCLYEIGRIDRNHYEKGLGFNTTYSKIIGWMPLPDLPVISH